MGAAIILITFTNPVLGVVKVKFTMQKITVGLQKKQLFKTGGDFEATLWVKTGHFTWYSVAS